MGAHASRTLTSQEATRIRERWGEHAAEAVVQAAEIFHTLDVVADGVLTRTEFSKSLGILGTSNMLLSSFLFDAIDRDGNGEISLDEFVEFMMVQFFGTIKDKLEFGFRVIDLDKNGVITKEELVTMIDMFFHVLSSFKLQSPEVKGYIDALWDVWDLNKDEQVTAEEYFNGCLSNTHFIRYLGMTYTGGLSKVRQIGSKVFMGQQKWDFMLSVMIGIQIATENLGPPLTREFEPDDFEKTVTFSLPADGHTAEIESIAPDVFREIRKSFGVGDQSFASSLGMQQILGSLLMGDLTGLSELVSEGKSGSFFYFSADNRFLVKTISQNERRTLVSMLANLLDHVQTQPNTLITRIYGLYRIRLDDTVRRFVVMENVFNASLQVHERFDIKGSTVGRTVGEENINNTSMVFKDLDLLKRGRTLNVRSDVRVALLRQIEADSRFLEENGIIDYSLLVGVHKVQPGESSPEVAPVGGLLSSKSQTQLASAQSVASRAETGFATTMPVNGSDEAAEMRIGSIAGRSSLSRIFSRGRRKTSKGDIKAVFSTLSDLDLPTGKRMFQLDEGGILSERVTPDGKHILGEEIMFVGIIDTLVSYEAFKQAEHLFKSIIHDGSKISVVPPNQYGPRFRKFVAENLFSPTVG